ncbi:MAG: DUF167 domain-containing protein [Polyangiaceae bacterium]
MRVKPRAKRSEIGAFTNGALELAVRAPPVEGAANEEVSELLAEALGVRARDVEIVVGQTNRKKVVEVTGVSAEVVKERLGVVIDDAPNPRGGKKP